MRNLKKFLAATIATATLTVMLCLGASAAPKFTDVKDGDTALVDAVDLLSYLNVTKGTSETTFGTNEKVTRQQMAAFIYRLMKKGASVEGGTNSTTFTDLVDSTYFSYISWADSMGIIKGRSETQFDPTGTITLQEAYTMLTRALGYDGEDYVFPHSYIDVAEQNGVELDKGLPSGISYETPLSRGAVAIVLYNTFFAEMSHTVKEYGEYTFQSGKKELYEKNDYHPTLAEEVYEVIKNKYVVRATPKMAFNDTKNSTVFAPLCDSFDGNMMQFVAINDGGVQQKPAQFFYDFDELSLEGNVDDYIMGEFEFYYTLDEKEENVEKIFYVDASMEHKTSKDITYDKITPEIGNSNDYLDYHIGGSTASRKYPLYKSYIEVNGKKIYFFDAPYSYIQPQLDGVVNNPSKIYELQNADNAKFINIKLLDENKGTYSYYIEEEYPTETRQNYVDMYNKLHQVTTSGFYKFDIYDVDGDGIYEYVRYRPYVFGKFDGDEGQSFTAIPEYYNNMPLYETNKDSNPLALKNLPVIYYNGANLSGVKINDGDFGFAYLNPEANEIDVYGVAEKTRGVVSANSTNTKEVVLNGATFHTLYQHLTVRGYKGDGAHTDRDTGDQKNGGNWGYTMNKGTGVAFLDSILATRVLNEEFIFYSFKNSLAGGRNNLYFYEPLTDKGAVYNKDNIIIPINFTDNALITPRFDVTADTSVFYLKAWVDGKIKTVPVSISDMYPKPQKNSNWYDFGVSIDSLNSYGVSITADTDEVSHAPIYLGKICNYSVDKNGIYTITSLLHARDEDGNFYGINNDSKTLAEKDNTDMYGRDFDDTESMRILKVVGNRYKLVDDAYYPARQISLVGGSECYINDFVLTDSSKIIIRNRKTAVPATAKYEDRYEYLEFDAETFSGSSSVPLTNVQYILTGIPDDNNTANLAFLYAEADDFDFTGRIASDSYRFVLNSTVKIDENEYYRNYYTLFNPYTGETVEDVPGTKTAATATQINGTAMSAKVLTKIKEDKVDDVAGLKIPVTVSGNTAGLVVPAADTDIKAGLVWITEYDEQDNTILVTNVLPTTDCWQDAEVAATMPLEIDSSTVVTLNKTEKESDLFNWKGVSLISAEALGSTSNEYRCYNDTVETWKKKDDGSGDYEIDTTKDYRTGYAKYIKAYIVSTNDAARTGDPDDIDKAIFVVITVHGDENKSFLQTHTETLHTSGDAC